MEQNIGWTKQIIEFNHHLSFIKQGNKNVAEKDLKIYTRKLL